jgi:hypothetical protein
LASQEAANDNGFTVAIGSEQKIRQDLPSLVEQFRVGLLVDHRQAGTEDLRAQSARFGDLFLEPRDLLG